MSLRDQVLKRSLPPGLPLRSVGHMSSKRNVKRDFTPSDWNQYFDGFDDICIDEKSTFRVYKCGFNDQEMADAPILFLIHGGGYSALTWSVFVKSLVGLIRVRIAAVDLRGHGSSRCDDEEDMSAETLAQDVAHVYSKLTADETIVAPVILMGHSLGGAIAVRSSLLSEFAHSLSGLIVIDVVEGTAMDALQSMQSFLRSRPKSFVSLEKAIEWSVRSGQTKNVESARISMPAQLKPIKSAPNSSSTRPPPVFNETIKEDDDESEERNEKTAGNSRDETPAETSYEFRINLTRTERFWSGWFAGLSQLFLDSPSPAKLLLLAGIETLDRTLTIGQMQGKFQLQVLPDAGHAVHEDVPDRVAEVVAMFLIRNKLTTAKPGSEFLIRPALPGC